MYCKYRPGFTMLARLVSNSWPKMIPKCWDYRHEPPCPAWSCSFFFYGSIILHDVYVPHFLYPVCHWWAFRLIPCLCYCEQCCNKHSHVCVFTEYSYSSGYIPSNGIAGSNGSSAFNSLMNYHTAFHNGWINLHSDRQCKSFAISPHLLQHHMNFKMFFLIL